MPTNIKEIGFEEAIEKYLVEENGYISRSAKDHYDKSFCIDKGLVLEFIKQTQSKEWKKLKEIHGEFVKDKFFKRLDEEIESEGILDVLRNGIKDHSIRFKLAYFKSDKSFNQETKFLYDNNILSVVRQLKYSNKNENSIDMVLFLNGLPIFTIELKNQLSGQSVKNGLLQYRNDRDAKEKLLKFKRCLTHFVVDTEQAYMTTKLDGWKTNFLPFDKGNNNSSGNPINPKGYKTAYLWENIWNKDSLLEIIGLFMCLEKKEKKEKLIFPRYHQLDTVRNLIKDVYKKNSGHNYLIQHSAGSGKSNTIAWLAHRLFELCDDEDKNIFDSVVVVTDRRILDKQLRDTVMQFEQVVGVVKPILKSSQELKEALGKGEKIIITTLQKFSVIAESIEKMSGNKFAVIIDEAHSSQTGESSKDMRKVLQFNSLDEAARKAEKEKTESLEDKILKELRSRKGKAKNISFFAFTATPKQKTLEFFGIKDTETGKFYPFSLYSMKQAIEEGFILDVLENYTTFQVYFKLLKKIIGDPEYKKKKTQRLMINYVDKHEHAINEKVKIIVDHFYNNIATLIDNRSKAMIVTKSRLHAVRFKTALDRYLEKQGIKYKTLVAFSGIVKDVRNFTEAQMNGIPEKSTAEEFKKDEYRFMVAADKFQTGFDQPFLSVMYVDKKLSGVNAVQTLSRLNRAYPSKEETFVLDFVNNIEDIRKAFQPYYVTTILSEATDPNILYNLQRDILNFKIFSEQEVDDFCDMYFKNAPAGKINKFLDEIIVRFIGFLEEEKEEFRVKISDFIKKYAFISQIISFEDTSLEKLYHFIRLLKKKLPLNREELPYEVLQSIDMDSYKLVKTKKGVKIKLDEELDIELSPSKNSGSSIIKDEEDFLSRIIKEVNDKFETDFTEKDRVSINDLTSSLLRNKELKIVIENNPKKSAEIKYDDIFEDESVDMVNRNFDFYKKITDNPRLKKDLRRRIFDYIYKELNKKLDIINNH